MLVLTRREGQHIHLDNGVVITLVKTDGSKARIGIEAPESVKVYRSELLEVVQASKERFEVK